VGAKEKKSGEVIRLLLGDLGGGSESGKLGGTKWGKDLWTRESAAKVLSKVEKLADLSETSTILPASIGELLGDVGKNRGHSCSRDSKKQGYYKI